MGSGAENIYPLPPPVLLPLGEAAPRTPGAGPGRPRGGGHSAGPGPSARARQLWGAACDPCPRVWGRAEGPRREERLQTLRGGEEGGGGGGPAAHPGALPAPRAGRCVERRDGRAGPGTAPRLPRTAGARPPRPRGGPPAAEKLLAPLPGRASAGRGVLGEGAGCWGAFRARRREGNYPPPPSTSSNLEIHA